MSKKNLIFSTILLLAIVSVCFFSTSSVNTNNVVENEQNNDKIEILLNPKSSGYDITQKWNVTTAAWVQSVAVSADGKYMVVGTDIDAAGDELFFFNTSDHDGTPMWSVNTADNINSVAISDKGKYIAVAGDNYALLYNSTPSAGNKPMWNVTADLFSDYISVDISANGEYIALGHRYQTGGSLQKSEVYLYNNSFSMNKVEMWYQAINNRIYSVAISSDGNYIVVGAESGMTGSGSLGQITAINNTDPTSVPSSPTNFWMWRDQVFFDIYSVAISDDGKYVAACGEYDNTLFPEVEEIYLYHNFEFVGNQYGLNPDDDHIPAWGYNTTSDMKTIAISKDGSKLAAGGNSHATDDNLFYFNNSQSANKLPEWSYDTQYGVRSVDMTADGSYVVAGVDGSNLPPTDSVVFFNNSGEGPKTPEWSFYTGFRIESVSISSWGNYIGAGGILKSFLFYHARPIPRIISGNGGGDDDDDDDEEGAIPFGNHYLLFAAIAIASLVIITKRKSVFSKK